MTAFQLLEHLAPRDFRDGLADHYAALTDAEIADLVAHADALEPDARPVLIADLERRVSHSQLADVVRALSRPATPEESEMLVAAFRARPCWKCASVASPLQGVRILESYAIGWVVWWRKKVVIACPTCARAAAWAAVSKALLMGWFSFPFGLLLVPWTVAVDWFAWRAAGRPEASALLANHVSTHRGEILVEILRR